MTHPKQQHLDHFLLTEPSSPNPFSAIVKVDSANGCGICTRELVNSQHIP